MYKIAVMGDYDSIYGFATIGYDVIPVTDPGEAEDKLEELAEGGYGIIFVTEAGGRDPRNDRQIQEPHAPSRHPDPGRFRKYRRGHRERQKNCRTGGRFGYPVLA